MCKEDLEENDKNFASRNDRGKREFQASCRECQKIYRRKHYLDNKQKYIDKAHDYKQYFVEWFKSFKQTLKCEGCTETRYWVLDFHHKNPEEKDGNISDMVRDCNKQKLMDEIDKCMVLCANCHRDLHYQESLK